MGKMKRKRSPSLKWSFFIYLPFCIFFSLLGAAAIGFVTNDLQDWYIETHSVFHPYKNDVAFFIISYAQVVLAPLWVLFCVAETGILFYRRELKRPITILLDASNKISNNELDFTVNYRKQNELGTLCAAFEEMRRALEKNYRELWHSLEERKRLNSAFSHDLRTPLTVLSGYTEFLAQYVPSGQVSDEKLLSVLSKMSGQIRRLESYTEQMGAAQKLDDITPNPRECSAAGLRDLLGETGQIVSGQKRFSFLFHSDADRIIVDVDLVTQVYENILSNSARYAREEIFSNVTIAGGELTVSVDDDGAGFSKKMLAHATEPFYRGDDRTDGSHFGLGLYICRVLCEKCGGELRISNTEHGANVTARFLFHEL